MAQTRELIKSLKTALKAQGKTYADVAVELGLTEASVKRLFSQQSFSLSRLDQVCHLIALVQPDDFQETVARILEGKAMDFASKDVIQFAMMVVEQIESLLPLPPFEVWIEDFLSNQEAYVLYTHTLHRAGRLP